MTDEGPFQATVRAMRGWPDVVLIGAFLTLAGVFALEGVLDDWVRALLPALFLAIACALFARFRRDRR